MNSDFARVTCLVTCLVVFCLATSTGFGQVVYQNDFENYGAYAATANNGNLWFMPGKADGSFEADGWMDHYIWNSGSPTDAPQIVAAGGPHSGNESGYGDSIGLTNFDHTNMKGVVRALPAIPDLAAGEYLEMSALVHVVNATSLTYMTVGNDGMALGSAGASDTRNGIYFTSGGGNFMVPPLGPEPAVSIPELSSDWTEIKLRVYRAYHAGYEFDTTHIDVLSGPVGGALTLRGTHSNNHLYSPSYLSLNPGYHATMDNLSISIIPVPEPASLSMLALGSSLILLRRRRKNG